jgi:tetratricopeptide (TPR) repeat protein
MGASGAGILSFSLAKLRRLHASFTDLEAGRPVAALMDRGARRLAAELGTTAMPLLLRELTGDDDDRRRWAHLLLADLAALPELAHRLIAELRALVGRAELPDAGKLRAIALMTELGARPPELTSLRDPDAARRRSLAELAACLTSPAEVARATDHLLGEMPPEDLEGFVGDLVRAEPAPAALLIEELLVRDDVAERTRRALRDLRAASGVRPPLARLAASRRRPAATLGRHPDGRRILVVALRSDGRPARLRVLCALLAVDGRLLDAHHADDLAAGALGRAVLDPLGDQGFGFADVGLDAARGCLILAARSALVAGATLPRDFYLGRDLLGLRAEHLDGTGLRDEEAERDAMLGRAGELLRGGEAIAARPLLERYVAESPDDPDGHANLGLCALALGDPAAARRHLSRAAFLCPDEPLHQWNLAAAAFRADDLAACHEALRAYLAQRDVAPAGAERRQRAERFVAEFERLRDLRQPAAPAAVAPPRPRRATGRRRAPAAPR